MDNNEFDPVTRERNRNIEVRASIDVMFEALAHIQASLETTSEEKRIESYRKFKEALYDRFEYLVEERTEAESVVQARQDEKTADEEEGEDTIEKLWPNMSASE